MQESHPTIHGDQPRTERPGKGATPGKLRGTRVDEIEQLREEAWIGDAVLALFARDWLLTRTGRETSLAQRTALFELFVSNQFLSSFGEPTRVEAEIGRLYESRGLSAAFASIEEKLLPRFLKTARKKGYNLETENRKQNSEFRRSNNLTP
jgi:23S rRNA maturation mini-RNase III